MALLEIDNLIVAFDTAGGLFRAVDGVSMSVDRREVLAIVGECGSGKSVAMLAVMGLLPSTAKVTADRMMLRRHRPAEDLAAGAAQDRRQGHGDDLPGADGEPQPLLHRRLPDRGGAAGPHGHGPRRAPRPRHRTADAGRHPRSGRAAELLSAPDVGRPVPARDDRHRHRLQSEAADRRRADDRARRHHPEADPRPAGRPAGRTTAWG